MYILHRTTPSGLKKGPVVDWASRLQINQQSKTCNPSTGACGGEATSLTVPKSTYHDFFRVSGFVTAVVKHFAPAAEKHQTAVVETQFRAGANPKEWSPASGYES